MDRFHAHLADLDPKWDLKRNNRSSRENIDAALAAAGSDTARLTRLSVVLSNEVDAARYREELGKVAGQFKTSDLDRALAAAEQERERRETRQWEEQRDAGLQALAGLPGGMDRFHAHLADLDPKWDLKRNNRSSRENIDAALAAAGSDTARLTRLRVVLSNEVDAARYREELGKVAGQFKTSDLDRALAVAEQEREAAAVEKRVARLSRVFAASGGDKAFFAALDARKATWRARETVPADIDFALDMAEQRIDRTKPATAEHAEHAEHAGARGARSRRQRRADVLGCAERGVAASGRPFPQGFGPPRACRSSWRIARWPARWPPNGRSRRHRRR